MHPRALRPLGADAFTAFGIAPGGSGRVRVRKPYRFGFTRVACFIWCVVWLARVWQAEPTCVAVCLESPPFELHAVPSRKQCALVRAAPVHPDGYA